MKTRAVELRRTDKAGAASFPGDQRKFFDRRLDALIVPESADRREFLGSSEIAAVMGLAPEYTRDGKKVRQTAYDVWLRKTGDDPQAMDPDLELFLKRRKRFEPLVIQMLREEFEAEIVRTNVRYRDPELPFLAAELDFEYVLDGELCNGEIKTVSPYTFGSRYGWGEAGSDNVPIHYWTQLQMGLGIKRRRRGMLVALVGFDSMIFYPVDANETDIGKVRDAGAKFWRENVLAKVAPEPMTVADLDKLYKMEAGKAVEADDAVASHAMRLRSIDAQIDALSIEREFAEFEVKRAMRDAEIMVVNGRKIATWKEQNTAGLDQQAVKTKHPAVWKECYRRGKTRVFKTLRSAPAFEPGSAE